MALVTYTRLGMNARRLYWEIISHPNIQLMATMNEANGNVLDRCVRNRLNGTVSGSPTRGVALTNGFVGMAFDASDDHISFGSQAALAFGNNNPFTCLAIVDPNVSALGTICGERNDDNSTGAWQWYFDSTREFGLILFGLTSGLSRVRGNTILTNGTKYMIVSTADGTGGVAGIAHYLNGVAEGLTTITNTLIGVGARTADFAIGAHITSGSTYGERLNANGLGFLAVFNAVLTAAEIRRYAWLGGFL